MEEIQSMYDPNVHNILAFISFIEISCTYHIINPLSYIIQWFLVYVFLYNSPYLYFFNISILFFL